MNEWQPIELKRWLEALSRASHKSKTPDCSRDGHIVYLADRHADWPVLLIEPFVARGAHDGQVRPLQKCQWDLLARGKAKFISSEDHAIGTLFLSGADAWSCELPREPQLARKIVQAILETGRMHWCSSQNPSLRGGLPMNAKLDWRIDQCGNQSLQLVTGEAECDVLYGGAPFYFNKSQWLMGPLHASIPAAVADLLWRAPVIPPEETEDVATFLKRSKATATLPLPRTDLEFETVNVEVTPHLRVCADLNPISGRMEDYYVYLSFHYHDTRINEIFDAGEVRYFNGSKIQIIRRDPQAERRCVSVLQASGLVMVNSRHAQPGELVFAFTDEGSAQRWLSFARFDMPRLCSAGWKIDVARDFPFNVVEVTEHDAIDLQLRAGVGWWFDFNLGIVIDGERLPLLPILTSALADPALIDRNKTARDGRYYAHLPDGRMVSLPFDRVKKITDILLESLSRVDATGTLRINIRQAIALAMHCSDIDPDKIGVRFAEAFIMASGSRDVAPPLSFNAELRPYQLEGLSWLQFLSRTRSGGILADDMGLGKTVQAIAHIALEVHSGRARGPSLVVCPTSVLPNWMAEIAKFAPSLKATSYYREQRQRPVVELEKSDIVVTTYPTTLLDGYKLSSVNWHAVILDEAQAVKNASTHVAKNLRKFKSYHRVCMTGTPVENHLGELWSHFDFVMPGYLGTRQHFLEHFRKPIESHCNLEQQSTLAARIKPFLVRRTKEQVTPELPEKTEIFQSIELFEEQLDLYETVRLMMHKRVRDAIEQNGLASSQIVMFAALLKLRQVCCDPRLVHMHAAKNIRRSAKLEHLMEMLPGLIEQGRKVLLFSQFTSMLKLIKYELRKHDIQYVELTGNTADRVTPVQRFQNGEVPLFLLSLKAGGTGLNLTAADTVIHYDEWWNPAVQNQASSRAHRIGQDKPVFVYHLVCKDTIEEKMIALQRKKQLVADLVSKSAQQTPLKLTEADIAALLAPTSDA